MKKLFLMIAAATFAANVSAQNTVITSNKFGDNWYFGINAGVASTPWSTDTEDGKATDFKGLAPNVGLRIGKNLTTVFGLVAEGTVYFKANEKSTMWSKTLVNATNVNLLGSFNLSNLFGTYQGEPRAFEVIALGGFGWAHAFGTTYDGFGFTKVNGLTSKLALDFAFNLGSAKAVQFYVEPNIVYPLQAWADGENVVGDMQYNFKKVNLGVNLGLNFKFGNSNGTHNFAVAQLRDQNEIDQLNAKINELRGENSAKDDKLAAANRNIADLQTQLTACQNKPLPTAKVVVKQNSQLQPIVIFSAGKTSIDAAQYASIEMVAKYMRNHKDAKILIKGYASPEGDEERNKMLADGRAESVKNALIKRYKIAADRITAEGQGATSDLSEENDFNRVAMFFDTTVK